MRNRAILFLIVSAVLSQLSFPETVWAGPREVRVQDSRVRPAPPKRIERKVEPKVETVIDGIIIDKQILDTTPLEVSVNPPNETHAALGQQIVVTFSKQMDLDTVAPAITVTGIVLFPQNVPVNVGSFDGKNFFLTPKSGGGAMGWTPKAAYIIKIDTTAASKNNKHLPSVFTSNFYLAEHPCVEPELTLNVYGQCTHHKGDACDKGNEGSLLEGDCDPGFNDDETVVTWGEYTATWTAENVTYVMEDCHNYNQETDFDGDSGQIKWPWDGPFPGSPAPMGYSFLNRILREAFDPLSTAWAGGNVVTDRKAGTFHCAVTAYGSCGKMLTVSYSYDCP